MINLINYEGSVKNAILQYFKIDHINFGDKYRNNPYLVRLRRCSDNTEHDITLQDIAKQADRISQLGLLKFLNGSDLHIVIQYDLSGNQNHIIYDTAVDQPKISVKQLFNYDVKLIDPFQLKQLEKFQQTVGESYDKASIYTILLDLSTSNDPLDVLYVLKNVFEDLDMNEEWVKIIKSL